MGAKNLEELRAFQAAREFKLEVYRLFDASPSAAQDFKYRDQLFSAVSDAESDVAEGFHRWVAGEFAHFLSFALSSMAEARVRLQDGVDRRHFTPSEAQKALELGERAIRTAKALRTSLEPFRKRRGERPPRTPNLGRRWEPRTKDPGRGTG